MTCDYVETGSRPQAPLGFSQAAVSVLFCALPIDYGWNGWFLGGIRCVCLKPLLNRLFARKLSVSELHQLNFLWLPHFTANQREAVSDSMGAHITGLQISGNLRHKWLKACVWNTKKERKVSEATHSKKLIKNNSILLGTDSYSTSLFPPFRIIHWRCYWWFATFCNFPTILLLHYSSTSTF